MISVCEGVDNSVHAELNGALVKLTLSFNAVKICSIMITVIIADLLCHSIISQHVTALLHSEMWEVDERRDEKKCKEIGRDNVNTGHSHAETEKQSGLIWYQTGPVSRDVVFDFVIRD